MAIVVTEKHQSNYFIQVKSLFLVVESSNTDTFLRNASFDVILTSVTTVNSLSFTNCFA